MEIQELLLIAGKGALVGGLIGYLTNQLAVWMLFHPKKPAHVFGLQLPMTPGLVVKNQERLAEAIGRTVGNDLLDQETLLTHLDKINLSDPIRDLLIEEKSRLKDSNKPLIDVVGPDHRHVIESLEEIIADDISSRILDLIKSQLGTHEGLTSLLKQLLQDRYERPIGNWLSKEEKGRFSNFLSKSVRQVVASEGFKELLEDVLSKLHDSEKGEGIISLDLFEHEIGTAAAQFTSKIQKGLIGFLQDEGVAPGIRRRIAGKLQLYITQKFPMATMFINDEVIMDLLRQKWSDICNEAASLMEGDEVRERIWEELNRGIFSGLEGFLNELSSEEGGEKREKLAGTVQESLLRFLSEEKNAEMWDHQVETFFTQSIRSFCESEESAGSELVQLAGSRLTGLLETDQGKNWIRSSVRHFISELVENRPAAQLLELIPEREWDIAGNIAGDYLEKRAKGFIPEVLHKQMHVESIVTEKIRSFDTDRLEETIKRVSKRELSGIVRLGGVIGIIVGAATQVLYAFL